MTDILYTTARRAARPRLPYAIGALAVAFALLVACVAYVNSPRASFPVGERIEIPEGSSLSAIAAILDERHAIRSALLFRLIISFHGAQSSLHAGAHVFDVPESTFSVARAFIDQTSSAPPVRITIPEGSTTKDFDVIVSGALAGVERGDIEALVGEEGILFPDTYFVDEHATAEDIVALLEENRRKKIETLQPRIAASALSEREIITLASILEREANDDTSMRTVAGILLKRLDMGMALQVDATFTYLLGKESRDLTAEDLEMDSPFNTYKYPGLPPSPIGSPGLMAIEAVLDPIETDYLYYLTDAEGTFHYAETFDEHKANKAKYLQ